ncbi:MAG: glycosyltransferase [Desulfamplus sp.]|nr:glycosyltransferase [Desulfamplus sp.]
MKNQLFDILTILTVIHFISIGGLALYGLHRIWLLLCWFKSKKDEQSQLDFDQNQTFDFKSRDFVADYPLVTVQVPLYNEHLVAARIIDAVASFCWQKDKLEIQILDDSSDATSSIVKERVKYWSEKGVLIYAIFRKNRDGYKAGALQNGLKQSKGEFIAVFDADFIPSPDFLEKTIPHFYPQNFEDNQDSSSENIGMVQTCWGFLNSKYSWLTRLQALLLSPHFGIEHKIRFTKNLFFNFNGTAGVWRKKAIESAGGWQDDTVTEDLDLSYRAQLAGWQFLYLDDVVVPSELPVTLSDFRSQQERWSKGSIQTAKKILPRLIASPLPLSVKIESIAHLMANFCWLLGFIVTMTLYPVILYRIGIGMYQVLWVDIPLFSLSAGAILTYYFVYSTITRQTHALIALPILPIISIGLAPCFALSVLKGAFQRGGLFKRTPKFGITDNLSIKPFRRFNYQIVNNLLLNVPLFLYSLMPIIFTWQRETWLAIPFLSLFSLGFLVVVLNDLLHIDFSPIKR